MTLPSAEWSAAAAFSFGLLGSLSHCVAMCGGISVALLHGSARAYWRLAAYHVGRLMTYAGIGALVGVTGSLAEFAGSFSEVLRRGAVLVAAVFLWVAGVAVFVRVASTSFASLPGLGFIERWIPSRPLLRLAAPLLRRPSLPAALVLGIVLGFLPCGLVYTAASYALATGQAVRGAAVMLAFGLGTLPALALVGLLTRSLNQPQLRWLRRWFTVALGLLLTGSGVYYWVHGFPG